MKNSINRLWLDESGDSGFKFERGSSEHLVITYVYLETDDIQKELARIEEGSNKLKKIFSLTPEYEFKFSRCKNKIKREFFKTFLNFPIKYKAIVVNKKRLNLPTLKYSPRELYCEMIRRLLYDNNPPLEKAILVIDEAVAKIHQREFKGILKKYLSKNLVKKIIQRRSRSEVMIQIADMIAGSIFRKYEKKNDEFWQVVKAKERILIEF